MGRDLAIEGALIFTVREDVARIDDDDSGICRERDMTYFS